MGRVTLKRDGVFFRVGVDPKEALPPSFNRPTTYCNRGLAYDAALILSDATGFALADETQGKG